MTLVIQLNVKFRAFGIDFGKINKEFRFPVPQEAELFAGQMRDHLWMNERGVQLSSRLEVPA